MGPKASAYFRVLWGGRCLRGTRLEDDVGDARHVPHGRSVVYSCVRKRGGQGERGDMREGGKEKERKPERESKRERERARERERERESCQIRSGALGGLRDSPDGSGSGIGIGSESVCVRERVRVHFQGSGLLALRMTSVMPDMCPQASEHGTHKTVKARFWPWISGQSL